MTLDLPDSAAGSRAAFAVALQEIELPPVRLANDQWERLHATLFIHLTQVASEYNTHFLLPISIIFSSEDASHFQKRFEIKFSPLNF